MDSFLNFKNFKRSSICQATLIKQHLVLWTTSNLKTIRFWSLARAEFTKRYLAWTLTIFLSSLFLYNCCNVVFAMQSVATLSLLCTPLCAATAMRSLQSNRCCAIFATLYSPCNPCNVFFARAYLAIWGYLGATLIKGNPSIHGDLMNAGAIWDSLW